MRKIISLVLVVFSIAIIGSIFLAHQNTVPADSISGLKNEFSVLREALTVEIKKNGGKEAYKNFLAKVGESEIDIHTQAHIFGEALYAIEGLKGIEVCDMSLRYGCYHSFFGQAIYEQGISILPTLDSACREVYGKDTKCQHGLGHGLLVYTGYEELLKALELCESIPWQPTGGCSGGVFMEYNFHTMEQVDNGEYIRPKTENPFEPCDTLPERFQPSCYLEQVQWWQNVYDGDFTYIGTLCETLPKEDGIYDSCFRGIGNHYAESVAFDVEKIGTFCESLPTKEANELCAEGVSWLVVGEEEHLELYDAMCAVLSGKAKSTCEERR